MLAGTIDAVKSARQGCRVRRAQTRVGCAEAWVGCAGWECVDVCALRSWPEGAEWAGRQTTRGRGRDVWGRSFVEDTGGKDERRRWGDGRGENEQSGER